MRDIIMDIKERGIMHIRIMQERDECSREGKGRQEEWSPRRARSTIEMQGWRPARYTEQQLHDPFAACRSFSRASSSSA